VIKSRWIVRCVRRDWSAQSVQFAASLPKDWPTWLSAVDVAVGTPFLISPEFGYDVELNAFFRSPAMVVAARNTQIGYARDLKGFLSFLWAARERLSWRDAQEADHVAYLHWRRFDPLGPRVDGRTWDREVAAVNRFYRWQVHSGNVRVNPIPHRDRRPAPLGSGLRTRGEPEAADQTPATYSHSAGREKIEWWRR